MFSKKIILNIPHSSIFIPECVRKRILLNDKELKKEILAITDMYTEELYDFKNAQKVIAPVSRLVVDTERFVDDKLEIMSKIGMGVIYTKTTDLKTLRKNPSTKERKELLDKFYYPHHNKLFELTENIFKEHKKALIIDCHSFPSIQPPYEKAFSNNQNIKRPQICIGADKFHTSNRLRKKITSLFEERGYEVNINTPFSGSLVPLEYYSKEKNVQSVMIELRRDLYMNEKTGKKTKNFNKLKQDINYAISELTKYFYSDLT
ncbi:N-formylglutamate amidohydrolase [Pseudomonadota bacterium]